MTTDYRPSRFRSLAARGVGFYFAGRLRKEVASPRSLDDWVRFIFDYRATVGRPPLGSSFSLSPGQVPEEVTRLVRIVAADRPRRVLEVGSARGGTLFLFARAATPDALLIGMDLQPAAGIVGLPDWRAALFERAFGSPSQTVRVVRGDSHSEATLARVREILGGEALDFLFIDADHSYAGVKRDFELYTPLVRPGGLVGMHDIHPDYFHSRGVRTGADSGDVYRFWDEIKAGRPIGREYQEIVQEPDQDGYGIGVIRL